MDLGFLKAFIDVLQKRYNLRVELMSLALTTFPDVFFWKCRSSINNRINHIGSVMVTRVGFRILVKMPKYVVDYEQFNNNFFLLLNSLIFCLRQIFFSAFPRDGIFYFFLGVFLFWWIFSTFFLVQGQEKWAIAKIYTFWSSQKYVCVALGR